MAARDGDKPVSKAEFVGLLTLLALKDRERYRELRELGWSEAIPVETDNPN